MSGRVPEVAVCRLCLSLQVPEVAVCRLCLSLQVPEVAVCTGGPVLADGGGVIPAGLRSTAFRSGPSQRLPRHRYAITCIRLNQKRVPEVAVCPRRSFPRLRVGPFPFREPMPPAGRQPLSGTGHLSAAGVRWICLTAWHLAYTHRLRGHLWASLRKFIINHIQLAFRHIPESPVIFRGNCGNRPYLLRQIIQPEASEPRLDRCPFATCHSTTD